MPRPSLVPITLAIALIHGAVVADDAAPKPIVDVLLNTQTTILGQSIHYPAQLPAHITAAIVTLPPGAETGWHHHPVPLFAQILEGELTVDYGADGKLMYVAGDSFMEAIDTAHNGMNVEGRPVRILAVFLGVEGIPNSEPVDPPAKK